MLLLAEIELSNAVCCTYKTVGNVEYVLTSSEDTSRYGCKEHCVYEKKQSPGQRFCFKEGDLTATCSSQQPLTYRVFEPTLNHNLMFNVLFEYANTCFQLQNSGQNPEDRQRAFFVVVDLEADMKTQFEEANPDNYMDPTAVCEYYYAVFNQDTPYIHTEQILAPRMANRGEIFQRKGVKSIGYFFYFL